MRVARPVLAGRRGARHSLLEEGVEITAGVAEGLARAGVFAVYVEDRLTDGIVPITVLSDQMRAEAVSVLGHAFARAGTNGATRVPASHIEGVRRMVGDLLAELREFSGAISALSDLQGMGAGLVEHSVNVCVLGVVLGESVLREQGWRDFRGETRHSDLDTRLERLGMGLLLHDIGMLSVPRDIAESEAPVKDDDAALVREHPNAGVEILSEGPGLPALARVVVAEHHERWDGKGYPRGKAEKEIHQHARIASVADVYDKATWRRSTRLRFPAHEAREIVLGAAGTALDPGVVDVFSRVVAPYPEGTPVRLSDGMRGVVALNHRDDTTRPLVRITHDPTGRELAPKDVDLRDREELEVAAAVADPADPTAPLVVADLPPLVPRPRDLRDPTPV